jgi:hypothetical protein
MNINKSFKQKINVSSIDASLEALSEEVSTLFSVLDQTSGDIKKVEAYLKNLGANFSFRLRINETESARKSPKDTHQVAGYLSVEFYFIRTCWYLAWTEDENNKQYRLFFIKEEEEVVGCTGMGECCKYTDAFQTQCLLKKPFIETDINTRLQYSSSLVPFIESFKNYLRDYRIANEELPF